MSTDTTLPNCSVLVRSPIRAAVSRHFTKRQLEKVVQQLVRAEKTGKRSLSILLTTDSEIRKLNKRYRAKDKATDVLSFPVDAKSPLFHQSLGDLVISWETTKTQAKEYNTTIREEFLRLLVHGFLHLCGYDHENVSAKEAKRMQDREALLRRRAKFSR